MDQYEESLKLNEYLTEKTDECQQQKTKVKELESQLEAEVQEKNNLKLKVRELEIQLEETT